LRFARTYTDDCGSKAQPNPYLYAYTRTYVDGYPDQYRHAGPYAHTHCHHDANLHPDTNSHPDTRSAHRDSYPFSHRDQGPADRDANASSAH